MGAPSSRRPAAATLAIPVAALLACGICGLRTRTTAHPEVLIVVNGQSPLSVATGSYYRQKRSVPAANVLTLNVPLVDPNLGNAPQETIVTQTTLDAQILTPIEDFLTQNGLVDSIRIIVLTPGIPIRFTPSSSTPSNCLLSYANYLRDCARASVDAEIAVLFSGLGGSGGIGQNGEARNPYFDSDLSFQDWRTANPTAPLRYLVARLAGYQTPVDSGTGVPTDVKALIDAGQAMAVGGTVLVDEDPSGGYQATDRILLAAAAAQLEALSVGTQLDTAFPMVADATDVAGYASWGSNDNQNPGAPFYGLINGKLYPGTFAAHAITDDLVSTNARSFVSPPSYGQSLVADLIHLGAAGAAGNVYEPSVVGLARPPELFRHYFEGAPAIEAFYRSVPYLSWMNVYVGDPLMRAPLVGTPPGDRDGDGVPDSSDNCISIPNPDQRDTDGDGYGNLCDADFDENGVVTTSWGVTTPPSARGDIERMEITINGGGYDPDQDLDGDGKVDAHDLTIAEYWLFFPPGPSGVAP